VPFEHPQLGRLRLNREKLHVSGTDGMMLVVYHADPGTTDAEKLSVLGSALCPAGDPARGIRLPETTPPAGRT
jgi:hypothetical protein